MIKTDITTATYSDGDFMIDIVTGSDWYDAWLYRKNFGVKMLMFGIPKADSTADELLEMVQLDIESYKQVYDQEYPE